VVQKGFLELTKWCTRQTKWCVPLHKGLGTTLLTGWELHNSLELRPSWRWVWVWHYIRKYKALSFPVKPFHYSTNVISYLWESCLEIEYYSVANFECITEFDVL